MYCEYIYIIKYFFLLFFIFLLLFLFSIIFVYQKPNFEKVSPYECGFNPFYDARVQFEVKFYLIGILFIIFDIEISLLFPWIVSLKYLSFIGFSIMFVFIFILVLGFIYEWLNGALNW